MAVIEKLELEELDAKPSVQFGDALLRELADRTRGTIGINRAPFGAGEQVAHDIVERAAKTLGLDTSIDDIGNLYMTLPGRDRERRSWMVGSHLDSVPAGGNYDGAAGVVAGLVAVHALVANEVQLPADLTVVAMRAEEASSWFSGPHKSHFGSRAMFGQLSQEEMEAAVSLHDKRSLAAVLRDNGFHPDRVGIGRYLQRPERLQGFLELHIEQGPVLIERDLPVGVVTGIRGNLRGRSCRVLGEYAHSGAVPREYRRDALFAAAEFAFRLEQQWERWLADGRDSVCTFGIFGTDPDHHSLSKVPGEIRFVIDIRSIEATLLIEAERFARQLAKDIGDRRNVTVDLGTFSSTPPTSLSQALQSGLEDAATQIGLPTVRVASGGGHDAVSFVEAGVPTAMIFVRNHNGSHNPNEALSLDDFAAGARVLLAFLLRQP